jgi:serine/threonine protein kinase
VLTCFDCFVLCAPWRLLPCSYNTSADIWSVGITMIELAQGRPPLSRAHPMRVLMDTIHNPPPSLDEHFSKVWLMACLCLVGVQPLFS